MDKLKMADEKYKKKNITNVNKPFWSYCIIVSGVISITSIISYLALGALVFLLNFRPSALGVITIIIITIMGISFVICITIIVIRAMRKRKLRTN